jgi:hypothetical protein
VSPGLVIAVSLALSPVAMVALPWVAAVARAIIT